MVKIMLNDNYFINKEERYDLFVPKKEVMELYNEEINE